MAPPAEVPTTPPTMAPAEPPATVEQPPAPAAPVAPEAPLEPVAPEEVPEMAQPPAGAPAEAPAMPAPAAETTPPTVAQPQVMPRRLGPEGGPEIYTIQKGDNLWDICQKLFGDPFLWPRLWAMNQYITNPHLIFPNDQLRFTMGTLTTPPKLELAAPTQPIAPGELAQAETTLPPPTVPAEKLETAVPGETLEQEALGTRLGFDVRNYAFVSNRKLETAGRISHSGEEKYMLATGDIVYLQLSDRSGLHEGDSFLVIEPLAKVRHPKKPSKVLGSLVHYKGKVRVLQVTDTSITGVIEDSWAVSTRDDRIVPYHSLIRTVAPKENAKKLDGLVIESAEQQYLIGQRDIAFVNIGKENGLEDGDTLLVVRQGDGVYGQRSGLPDVKVAQLTVIEALDSFAIVYVNWAKKPIEVGDRVTTRL
jgi:hypothetical protein